MYLPNIQPIKLARAVLVEFEEHNEVAPLLRVWNAPVMSFPPFSTLSMLVKRSWPQASFTNFLKSRALPSSVNFASAVKWLSQAAASPACHASSAAFTVGSVTVFRSILFGFDFSVFPS
ncbi:MAG: hypothetical protein IPL86_04530 [Flavobacteriales bacterium]|nr:hypothetical protein [Flavobacteriales bacterium]